MRQLSVTATLAFASLLFGSLQGCTTQKTSYAAALDRIGPVANGHARIVLLRPDQRFDNYSLSAAHIHIDDEKAGKLAYGGFLLFDVDSSEVVLAASARNRFYGVCELKVSAKAGETLYLDVAPRPANVLAELAGAAVGAAVVGGGPTELGIEDILIDESTVEVAAASTAGGAAGSAVEAAGKPCGGPFRLKLLDAQAALEQLGRLSLSE